MVYLNFLPYFGDLLKFHSSIEYFSMLKKLIQKFFARFKYAELLFLGKVFMK